MSNEIPESKLATIRHLLALADESSGGTAAERENAAGRAAELMAKYAVTSAMMDAASGRQDDPVEWCTIEIDTVYPPQKRLLINELAQRLSCKAIQIQTGDMKVFGHRSDVERLEWLYTSLLVQALGMAAHVRDPRIVRPHSSQTRAYRSRWLNGFAVRIGERMDVGRTEAVAEAGSGAELVLVDRKRAAEAALYAAHPRARSRNVTISGGDAYAAGKRAGDRADLGQARVAGGRRALGA